MEVRVEWVAVLVSALFMAIAAFTYWRSGAWRREDSLRSETASQVSLSGDVKDLREKVAGAPTKAEVTSIETRLKAVESKVEILPTGQQLQELTGSVKVLEAEMRGGLQTMAAKMEGADEGRKGINARLARIEDHLLHQKAD